MSCHNPTVVPSRKPRIADVSMRFGLFWPEAKTMLPSAKMAERDPDALDLEVHMELARACEGVGLDFILLGDGYAPGSEGGSLIGFQAPSMHAIVLAAPIIMATRHMGVITTMHTRFLPPAQIARFGSHLDRLSGGRTPRQRHAVRHVRGGARGHRRDLARGPRGLLGQALPGARQDARPFPAGRPALVCAAAPDRGRRFTARHRGFLFASPPSLSDLPAVQGELDRHAAEAGRPHPEPSPPCSGREIGHAARRFCGP